MCGCEDVVNMQRKDKMVVVVMVGTEFAVKEVVVVVVACIGIWCTEKCKELF